MRRRTISDYQLPDGTVPVLLSADTPGLLHDEAASILAYVVDHPEVERAAPHEWLDRVHETPAEREIAGAGAGADERRPLPRQCARFIMRDRRVDRQDDRRDLGRGPQPEIDAANTVKLDFLNAQGQPKFVWPPSFAKARAFVDQLERSKGLSPARITAVRTALAAAEKQSGGARATALNQLVTSINADAAGSSDAAKVKMLSTAVAELAK